MMALRKNKRVGRKLMRTLALVLCLAIICMTMMGMGYAAEGATEVDTETPAVDVSNPEDFPQEEAPGDTGEPGNTEEVPEITPEPEDTTKASTEEPLPEIVYEIETDPLEGWYNAPVELTVYVRDVYESGWEKVEAALTLEEPESREDLTEQFQENDFAKYTVSDNGIVYFFITDLYGEEHTVELEVDFFDYDGPAISAGVRDNLLHVETYDLCTGVAGIYVNDALYTTLEYGTLDLRIDTNTCDPQFQIYSEDDLGNNSKIVRIANPFYQEPVEEPPAAAAEPQEIIIQIENPENGNQTSGGNSTVQNPSGSVGSTNSVTSQKPASATLENGKEAEEQPLVSIEEGAGFTQNGIAVTRDLLYDKYSNKQFITVETRNGETFYLVIDYDKPLDEEGDQYETYFLNMVDEADLLALIDEESEAPICACSDKCEAGAVNTQCEICKNNLSECTGKEKIAEPESEPEPTAEPEVDAEQDTEEKSFSGAVLLILLFVAIGGGGAVYWLKFRKPKADTKGPTDLDDYDFGDAEDEDDAEYEMEDDEEYAAGTEE